MNVAARSVARVASRAAAAPIAAPRVALAAARVPVVRSAAPSLAVRRFAAGAGEAPQAAAGSSWVDKQPKHPDYEGFEGVFRYYVSTNADLVKFVVILYGSLIGFAIMNNNAKKARIAAAAPAPEFPDFHTKKEE